MADLLPKVKLYVLLSFVQIIINIGIYLSNCVIDGSFNMLSLFANIGTSFAPLTSFIPLAITGFPLEVIAIISVFTVIITGLQIYLLIEIVASHIPTVNI